MMTKMAIYEKNEGRKSLKTAKYYKSDFIAFGVLKSLITTTIAYVILVVLVVLCNLEDMLAQANDLDYIAIGKQMCVYYVIMLLVFSVIAGLVSAYRYDQYKKGLKKYSSRLNKLERFYNVQKSRG
ncbi:MAG: hypothetical protein IJB96_04910 [Lachnospira sp.]|nr:hypothetical protein [Lachnospira sp.]